MARLKMSEKPRFEHGYFVLLLIACSLLAACGAQKANFRCPAQFGYFSDPGDCNRYFICVFGDALHDKCTPGLHFNDELRMCDWPRNVPSCGQGPLSGSGSIPSGRRVYGTSTTRPQSSGRSLSENIHSINSIAPTPDGRVSSRYTPPIAIGESFALASRNGSLRPTVYMRPSTYAMYTTSSTRPYLYSTGAPASFKPVYYRVTSRPVGPTASPRKRKPFNEDYYDGSSSSDYDDESSLEEPLMVNQHLRNGHTMYVRPISISTIRTTKATTRPMYNSNVYGSTNPPQGPPNTRNYNNNVNAYSNFNTRGQATRTGYADTRPSTQDERSYTRTMVRPAAPTHGSNVRVRTPDSRPLPSPPPVHTRPLPPSHSNNKPQLTNIQSLDNTQGDSLDAQFGTNPRSISLPDKPYRLNSFESSSELRKAEKSKPKVVQSPPVNRYPQPPVARPAYKTESVTVGYDEYPEYYYDDDEYEDDDDAQHISPQPKVVIRLQKPPSTTRRTTTTTTSTTTTRKPATTKRPTTRPPKRALPFGISRPATKSPIRSGPKPLPRLPSRPPAVYATPQPLVASDKCSKQTCALPDCRCAGSDIPGNIPAGQVPQIVLITFDDAVNDLNQDLYRELFDSGRKNPNGCPILGTFYVSHEWTDYGQVQTLYSKGHEMASHSITHSHGEKFSVSHWAKEMDGQREILHLYGAVKLEDVRGMRAPFLQVGGNSMFEMLYRSNFTYDSSMPVLDNNPPHFPYTLDYRMDHECMIPPCPSKSFPGLWEVGMIMWNDYRGGRCSMGDACANPDNAEDVFKMLLKNFERHYHSNRAPFGLFYHAAWFTTQHYRKGYMKFIDYINAKDDVYMVTNWQAIQWMRDPTPTSRIRSFQPWQCPKTSDNPGPCHHPTSCSLHYKGGSRTLKTCQPCPSQFPWSGRTGFDEVYAV